MDFAVTLVDKVSGAAKSASSSLSNLGKSFLDGKDLSKNFEAAVTDLLDPMALATAGAALASAAVLALGAAFIEGAEMSLEASGNLAKMTAQFDALGSTSGTSGKQLLSQFDALSEKLPATRDQLADMAKPLIALGLSGDKLDTALTARVTAMKISADGTAGSFDTLQKKIQTAAETGQALKIPIKGLGSLADMGLNVNDVAQKMGISQEKLAAQLKSGTVNATKFGDALNAALIDKGKPAIDQANNSLTSLGDKFKANVTELFEDVDPSPLTKGLKDVTSLVDKNTASGKLLHTVVTAVYTKFFALAATALPYVKHGLQDIEIAGLKVYIASKPLIKELGTLSDSLDDGGKSSGQASLEWNELVQGFIFGAKEAGVLVGEVNTVVSVIKALSNAADVAEGKVASLGKSMGSVSGGGGGPSLGSFGSPISAVGSLLGHAEGGVVTGISGGLATVSAAPGEGLASIGKGETIMPASAKGASSGGGTVIHATVTINKTAGESDADITEEQLSLVVERVALSQGLGRAA